MSSPNFKSKLLFKKLTPIKESNSKYDKEIDNIFDKLQKVSYQLGNKSQTSSFINISSLNTPFLQTKDSNLNQDQKIQNDKVKNEKSLKKSTQIEQNGELFKGPFQKNYRESFNNTLKQSKTYPQKSYYAQKSSESNSKQANNSLKNLDKYYMNSEIKQINHIKNLSNKNNDFLKNVKKSMSMETIYRKQNQNKTIYMEQKTKNLNEVDVYSTDLKNKHELQMHNIFNGVREAEEEAKRRQMRNNTVKNLMRNSILGNLQNLPVVEKERNYENEFEEFYIDESKAFKNQMRNSELLWKESSTEGQTDEERLLLYRDYLKEQNKNQNNKYINEGKFDLDQDFEDNQNWNFKENMF